MVIVSVSPRSTAPNHTPTSSPSSTAPITFASGAIHTRPSAGRRGERPSRAYIGIFVSFKPF